MFGTSAITAITAQNTLGVQGVRVLDPEIVRAQIASVCADLPPAAAKTGMLADAPTIRAVAIGARECGLERLVVDPVMVATSGDRLLEEEAVDTLVGELLPLAALITPNRPEAEILAGLPVQDEAAMKEAARRIVDRGAAAVLVKGGHLGGDRVLDLLWDGSRERAWPGPRIETTSTHGTGCTLSAAIAACLARGLALEEAVDRAIAYTRRAIASAPGLGGGHGPLNHRVPVSELELPPDPEGRAVAFLLEEREKER